MRISRAPVSRRRRRAISSASLGAMPGRGSGTELLLEEGRAVLEEGVALAQPTAQGDPVAVDEGDPTEVDRETSRAIEVVLAGPPEGLHPRTDKTTLQMNR